MVKKILIYPEDKVLLSTKSVDANWEDCAEIIQDLKDTLKANDGVGISAIQIGIPKRVCYINYGGQEFAMINPKITWRRSGTSGVKLFKEGCLSAPGVYTMVERSQKVICQYTNEKGEKKEIGEGGWMSAIIQHELDHFEGDCEVFHAIEGE